MKYAFALLSSLAIVLPAASTHGEPEPAPKPYAPGPETLDLGSSPWPSEISQAPTKEQWAGVKKLTTLKADAVGLKGGCDAYVLHEWVRLLCSDLMVEQESASAIGAVWAVAGNVEDAKAEATMVGQDEIAGLMKEGAPSVRHMASMVEVTFPLRKGKAVMLEIVGARWAFEEYNGNFFTSIDSGLLIDASWALGEDAPTLIFSKPTH